MAGRPADGERKRVVSGTPRTHHRTIRSRLAGGRASAGDAIRGREKQKMLQIQLFARVFFAVCGFAAATRGATDGREFTSVRSLFGQHLGLR